ncbi:glycosyltransferase [Desulfonatronovibrio magnus]|uniref:glycosyltransferase family protein n=1 Tax=Desulfonatronovibrio magnus TaxID=698827 RepID=UPI0005EB050A|nr:glycosyltransferase [Desulfonatronovibrio magnus]RQD65486.1 MAG: glycosyltransferase family 1 protein [Desulfonatronovibrio sp. MSAO_Bac4]
MRILNISGSAFVPTFRSLGHQVLSVGSSPSCDVHLKNPMGIKELWDILKARSFYPDLVFWNDTCRPPEVFGIEKLPGVTIGFTIDQYCNPWHVPYSWAFDLLLVAQKDYLPFFVQKKLPRNCQWFPLFCNEDKDFDFGLDKDIPVSFVGTLNPPLNRQRPLLLKNFKKLSPLYTHQGQYAEVFSRSMIVLNQSAAGELNFRLFQAACCGAAVLTEDVENGLRDIFRPGEDILPFYKRGNHESAVSIAKKALSNPEKTLEIAKAGQNKVRKEHSVRVRAKRIISMAERLIYNKASQWRRDNLKLIENELRKSFLFLAADRELPLTKSIRDFYMHLGIKN